MDTEFNPDLIEDLAARRTVLFLGTGVTSSALTVSGTRIKQWEEFLRFLSTKMKDVSAKEQAIKIIDEKDYLMSCEIIREDLGPDIWDEELRKEFAQTANISELH